MHVAPVTLAGQAVRIEPLAPRHAAALFAALAAPGLWTWLPRGPLTSPADAAAFIAAAIADSPEGPQLPFALLDGGSGALAGTTRYMDIRPPHRSLEIGWTIVGPEHQRTALNTETKLLLMRHAFDTLGAVRVQFKTDHRNEASQRALERLGATREGVLRCHRLRPDGTRRDSVYYSVIDREWPDVRRRLEWLLTRRAGAACATPDEMETGAATT